MIKNLPLSERPRERCLETGAACLSLRECLALILGTGSHGRGCLELAASILARSGEGMGHTDEQRAFFTAIEISGNSYLKEIPGLGEAGQAKILAAFELGRRYSLYRTHTRKPGRFKYRLPDLAANALTRIGRKSRCEPQEWLGFVPIHRSGEMGELCLVEKGVRTHVNVDPAELFARILALRPRAVFLFHNHPSGDSTPSLPDLDLTENVRRICAQFGIQLLGHWIVTPQTERWIDAGFDVNAAP